VRPGTAVRHADAAGVDDLLPLRQARERHVRVPADNRRHIARHAGEHVGPPVQARVGEDDLRVVAGRAVTEQHRPEAVDLKRDGVRQCSQPVTVIDAELPSRPG
jgi:hypothetical protein